MVVAGNRAVGLRDALHQATRLTAVAALYFLVGALTLAVVPGHSILSTIWPATGLAIAALLLLDYRIWPGLLLGAIATALAGLPKGQASSAAWLGASLGVAMGKTSEALAGAWLANRFAQGRHAFERPDTVLIFGGLSAGLSTLLGPLVGIASSVLAGYETWETARGIWFGAWLGGMVSVTAVTPLVVVWTNKPMLRLSAQRQLEAAVVAGLLLLSCQLAFNSSFAARSGGAPLAFLTMPFLIWSALRFNQRATASAVFAVACLSIAATLLRHGPFTFGDSRQALLLVQNYVFVISLMSLILAADVTQRRQCDLSLVASERRYRQLFEDNPQPMWVFDYETLRILAVNKAAIRHYGYSREEFLDLAITDISPSSEVPALLESESQARLGVEIRRPWQHLKKDGTIVDVEVAQHNLIFDGKQAAMVLSTDLTHRKRAEKEVLHLNMELEHRVQERTAQLEAINKELEAFCYSVSHDLRAPLRSVRGFCEVLLERYAEKLDARGREFLKRACQSSQHMDSLIEDLLKLSRVGRSELKHQVVDLSGLVEAIAGELRRSESKRQVKFTIAPALKAQGDERLLRIVLENLLRNAWKFTGRQPKPAIEFGFVEKPEPAFFVRDNGAGFEMAYAGRLFGVFQRLHSATEYPGTGVGLATVQRIINRHGGRAWAEGELDRGATFYFSLPAEAAF